MFYFITTPQWLKRIYASCTWHINTQRKVIYLSFDDGPHPEATPFVLAELKKYDAKASFFCIGKNVATHQRIYAEIIAGGHAVGNHTYNHLNGWKTTTEKYVADVEMAQQVIESTLFRPPYGKISFRQIRALTKKENPFKIIMWSLLSADFDKNVSAHQCLNNVIKNTRKGSIVVFHDSTKAWEKLQYVLPKILMHFSAQGYRFEKLSNEIQ